MASIKASIKQISADLGVSSATVSNALTGKGRVSKELADRIRAHADQLGYRPSFAARALKTGQSGILGLVMPDLTNPLFPKMAQSLAIAADRRGLGILIADSRGSAEEQAAVMRRLAQQGVDGLLVVPHKEASRFPQRAPEAIPVAIIHTPSDPNNAVSSDHRGGGALVGRHIAELGHRRAVLLGGDPASEVQRDRIMGMRDALAPYADRRVLWARDPAEDGLGALERAIAEGATAVLTTSDLVALEAHAALSRAGLAPPRDYSLTGFDDLPFARVMHPALTTVAQDVEQIADRAIGVIDAMIRGPLPDGTPRDDAPTLGQTVPMRLIVRHSTSSSITTKRLETSR